MKLKLIMAVLLFACLFGLLLIKPAASFAACDFRVNPLYTCYNSKTFVGMDSRGGKCYDGNWRIRGTIVNDGNTVGVGWYQLTGASKLIKHYDFSLAPKTKLDTNDTIRLTLCGTNQIMLYSSCNGDPNYLNNYWFTKVSSEIPACQ